VGLLLAGGGARAAAPTTAECLAASDASLKFDSEHKLRAERSQLLVCAAPQCPAEIRKECVSRVDEVNAEIPTLILQAKDASGADLTAVKVAMDGEVLADRLEGTALSVDPGEHTFTFEIAGQSPLSKTLLIQQSQKDRREVVTFGPPTAPGTVPAMAHVPAAGAPTAASPAEGGHALASAKILALAAGVIGVAGLGVGTAFGLSAMSKRNDAQSVCPNLCADQSGVNKWSDAASAGNISTIGFVGGGAAVAGAVVLWLTAPSGSSAGPTAQVGFGPGALRLRGTW